MSDVLDPDSEEALVAAALRRIRHVARDDEPGFFRLLVRFARSLGVGDYLSLSAIYSAALLAHGAWPPSFWHDLVPTVLVWFAIKALCEPRDP